LKIAVTIAALLLVWWSTNWAVEWVNPQEGEPRNEFIRTILTGFGAAALLLQLRYTHKSTRAATRTLELSEQGQFTDRFFKAVEQLGRPELPLQLGALFALQRIAEDSRRDYRQVYLIIAAFVRMRTKLASEEQKTAPWSEGQKPTEEVQTALNILGAKRFWFESDFYIDLRGVDIRGATFVNADLRCVDFSDSNLSGVKFQGGSLERSRLLNTFANSVQINRTRLTYAQLIRANLTNAIIQQVMMKDMEEMFLHTSLYYADITGAQILVKDLSRAIGLEQHRLDTVAALFGDVKLPKGLRIPEDMTCMHKSANILGRPHVLDAG
jgi:hypothetical protein